MLNFFKSDKLKENKTFLFVTAIFTIEDLEKHIRNAFKLSNINVHKINTTSSSIVVDFEIKETEKAIESSRFRFLKKETTIYVYAESVVLSQENYKETTTAYKTKINKHKVFKFIQEHILKDQNDGLYAFENKEKLPFIQIDEAIIRNYIFHQLKKEEYVLSVLNIDSISFEKDINIPKNTKWQFVLTSLRTLLVGSAEDDFLTLDVTNESLALKQKIGKDTVKGISFSFLTELMNDTDYEAIFPVVKTQNNKLNAFGDCLVISYNSKEAHIELLSKCYALAYANSGLEVHCIKSELIKYLKSLKLDKKNTAALKDIFKTLSIDYPSFGSALATIVKRWNLSYELQLQFSGILLDINHEEAIKNSIDFLGHFQPLFLEKEKQKETIFEFNLKYGVALAKAQRFKEAIAVYEAIYKALPDDSIVDLLPTKTTNVLKGEGGHDLKVTILESILEWEEKALLDTSLTNAKLLELQPLVYERLSALKDTNNYQEKIQNIESILNLKHIKYSPVTYNALTYNRLEKKAVQEKVIPKCFENATGFFDSLNSYIASIKTPDYDAVIAFSDKLSATNYPEVYKIITNICYALKIDSPECYIGRANYANMVIGVEGKPPYLIVGINFIEASSKLRLNYNELKFLIAIELAHIYFEHSKITASDVWQGAAEKGFTVVSTLLTLLPFAGSLGNILGNIANVDKYAKIVNGVKKASDVAEKGKDVMEVGEKLNINLLSNDKKGTKSQDLLITSRLMEIIADKLALVFCGNIHAAVKSIVVSSISFEKDLPLIEQYGLYKLLERTNDKGEFHYQETIIRIKSLCSFYLSNEYELIKEQLFTH